MCYKRIDLLFHQLIPAISVVGLILCGFSDLMAQQSQSLRPSSDVVAENLPQSFHFQIIEQGNISKIQNTRYIIADSQEAWEKLWRQYAMENNHQSQKSRIDFTQYMILGIFLGQRATGGYSVVVEKIVETENHLIFSIIENLPPSGAMVTQALTSPFQIIQIARSDKSLSFQHHLAQ